MWSDVDFPAGVIHVRHNALLTNAQTTVSDTLKTSAAVDVYKRQAGWSAPEA